MSAASQAFKGNKRALPSKHCVACERPMTWRKAWAKNWEQVKYCSDACRQQARSKQRSQASKSADKPASGSGTAA